MSSRSRRRAQPDRPNPKTGIVYNCTPQFVAAWFAKNAPVRPVLSDGETDDDEIMFEARDGRSRLSVVVTYVEGCPTCGGAYVRRWTYRPQRLST